MATFKKRKKTCYFTDNKIEKIDWKDVDLLKKFTGLFLWLDYNIIPDIIFFQIFI